MKIFLTFILLLTATCTYAQTTVKNDTLFLISRAYKDSVVLRWAPGSNHLWKIANQRGYRIERRRPDERKYTEVVSSILPYSLREWKNKCDTTNVNVATAAQMLLGDYMMKPENAASFSQKLLTHEEQKNRLALALYSAEFSVQAATGLAFRWVDKNVDPGATYFYRVTLTSLPRGATVIPGVTRQNTMEIYEPRPVNGVKAIGKDGEIEIRWKIHQNDAIFSGYFIERSEDGKNFQALTDIPVKSVAGNQEDDHIYVDKIAEYGKPFYYRVRGITSFADLGLYSEPVKAHTRDLHAPAPPATVQAKSVDEHTIKITWTDTLNAPDHTGYFVGRATNIHGPFDRLNAQPLSKNVREFTDLHPVLHRSNFYTLIATDTAGNENQSVTAMAILKDSTPPARPEGLTGEIDTLGIVSLGWELGGDEDLMGYRVYRSDHPDAEYIQITKAPVPGNFFLDTIPVNTLTRKVYYMIAAFDFNYNPSGYSEVLVLTRPDYSPPVRPVINGYSVTGDTLEIRWVPSSSADVASHTLYKKRDGEEWQPLMIFSDTTRNYRDGDVASGHTYHYAVEATDKAGWSSGKSNSILLIPSVRRAPVVKNIRGEFDRQSKAFNLFWDYQIDEASKFIIYRAVQGQPLTAYGTVSSKARTFSDHKLYLNEAGYSYAVRVLFSDGTESPLSQEVSVDFNK